jgi:Putative peptidoglycan binding domain
MVAKLTLRRTPSARHDGRQDAGQESSATRDTTPELFTTRATRRGLSTRRVVLIAAAVVVAAGAAGAAVALTGGNGSPASSSSSASSVSTAPVVRTNLTTTVQVGGSIGYDGSYTIGAPSGASASQVSQAQQAVTRDQQTLASDEQAESDGSSGDSQTISTDQANVNTDQSTLNTDTATKNKDCAGKGASTMACTQDTQKVSQDQNALTQAQQALATAQSMGKTNGDQQSAKVSADQTTLQGDQNTLASLLATAVNPGTAYTSLPTVGDIIKQDQPVYSVSDKPVPLLYGSIPAYRAFYVGMPDGADVGELTHDLIVLGYANSLPQSNTYSSDTAAAVERWQTALGLPATGEILLGEAVFEPGPIRVTSVTPSVGESIGGGGGGTGGGGGGGTVVTATSTTPIVTVDLDVTQEYLVKPGDAVSVVLPDGATTVGGHVETVGNVATCPGGGGAGTGNTSADNSTCSSAGGGSNSTPTVTVTIALDKTSTSGATLDQAPVNVNITSQRVNNVLAVPVNALLALAGGGYAVQVVTGSTSHLVAVTTGLYSNTLVQVSGAGITPGTLVEVPSS